ncbi:hypothetical protein Tco_0032352 [Tanacetum coccineum]
MMSLLLRRSPSDKWRIGQCLNYCLETTSERYYIAAMSYFALRFKSRNDQDQKKVWLNGYMAWFTTQWKWLADVVPEDCVIHLIGEKFVALPFGIGDESCQDETL